MARQREAGDIAVPGSAVLTLISMEELWISAWVDETMMSKLAVQQPARIVFRSLPDRSYPGTVVRLGKQADRETREFIVDVQLKELPDNWAVGQRVEVFIQTGRAENVLTMPLSTVIRRNEKDGVFVADNGVVRWKPVMLGLRGRDLVEVREGLAEHEVLLAPVAGTIPLTDGRRVRVP